MRHADDARRGGDFLALAAAGVGAALVCRAALRHGRRFDFAGKTVLITGGSRGLGLLLARLFAGEGARVAICARDEAELDRAAEDLRGRGGADVLALPCDLTDREQVRRMVRHVVDHFAGIDVLVNNAGIISVGPMEVMTIEDYEQAMRTHFWAPLYTTMEALPHIKARGGGRVVNVSSVGGKLPAPHLLPYTASKFALTGFSEGLRVELAKDNIFVTTVCPGLMRTGSPRNADFKGQHRKEYAWFTISDSLPITSMNARRAAAKVVEACRYGVAEVVLSVQAKLAVTFHDLFPGLYAEAGSLVNRLLPGPGGIGERKAKGHESESAVTRSWATALTRQAERENNEVR